MAGNWMFMDLAGSQDQTPPERQLRKLKDDLQLFTRQVRYELYHLTEKNFVDGVLESGTVSDQRRKSGIRYDLERYAEFYRRLRPCAFRYKGREVEGYHIGVIAQDTEKAALEAGLDRKDVAAVYIAPGEEYRVRYEELAALNLWMIQQLTERVEKLEQMVKENTSSGASRHLPLEGKARTENTSSAADAAPSPQGEGFDGDGAGEAPSPQGEGFDGADADAAPSHQGEGKQKRRKQT